MKENFIKLSKIVSEFNLKEIYSPQQLKNALVKKTKISRLGLAVCGFLKDFKTNEVKIVGNNETNYLKNLNSKQKKDLFLKIFDFKTPFVVVCNDNEVFFELLEVAKIFKFFVFKTEQKTFNFILNLKMFFKFKIPPFFSVHGVLVEVFGEGVLITGQSGVGKSETAIKLIKKGSILVADDKVEIFKLYNKILIGRAPKNIRCFMELKNIGIVNIKELYGVKSVKKFSTIDMVVYLKREEVFEKNYYEKEINFCNILNVKLPKYVIKTRPYYSFSTIIEIFAINNKKRKMNCNLKNDFLIE